MVTITKDKIATLLWNTFYDKLKANVTSLTVESNSYTIQTYASSYNDKMLDSKSNYPIIIINFPERTDKNITLRNVEADCSITIEINANSSVVADAFFDEINNVIESSTTEFLGYGIEELIFDDANDEMGERGKIKIHNRKSIWKFKYVYTK